MHHKDITDANRSSILQHEQLIEEAQDDPPVHTLDQLAAQIQQEQGTV